MAGDHCQNYLPYHFGFRRGFFSRYSGSREFRAKFFFFGGGVGGGGGGGGWGNDSPRSDHQLILPIPIYRASRFACQR